MMDETLTYLKSRAATDANFTWEIIIVDDGSPDRTTAVANTCDIESDFLFLINNKISSYVAKEGTDNVRLLKLQKNVGKGGAVRRGMMYARGAYILMVDADGATKVREGKEGL